MDGVPPNISGRINMRFLEHKYLIDRMMDTVSIIPGMEILAPDRQESEGDCVCMLWW